MSVLRNLESKLAGLVEGTFNRAFKSEVRPVEIARKLAREMDEHKTQSLSRTYAPNEYVVWLSSHDHSRLEGYEHDLKGELAGYLLEHARRERYALVTRPRIDFKRDDRLALGEFGIQTRMVQEEQAARHGARRPAPEHESPERRGHTMVYSTAERLRRPGQQEEPEPPARDVTALLELDGRRLIVPAQGAVLGRSRDCEITLDDANVSRRHAELRPSGGAWLMRDLGSTNGVTVNGRRIDRPQVLTPGDVVELGTTRLTFRLE